MVRHRITVIVPLLAMICCTPIDESLPPVKTPIFPGIVCQPPELFSPGLECPVGDPCGLPALECDVIRTVVIEVNRLGQATSAYVKEHRSASIDACILRDVQDWRFLPALECNGEPTSGSFTVSCGFICEDLVD